MSLLNLTDYNITTAFSGGLLDISFMTTFRRAQRGEEFMRKADIELANSNFSGAVDNFFAAYAPLAEAEERQYVLKYLNTLGVAVNNSNEEDPSLSQVQCMVFREGCIEDFEEDLPSSPKDENDIH